MLQIYGDKNGFGWQLDEIVGVQMLAVSEEFLAAYELVAICFRC